MDYAAIFAEANAAAKEAAAIYAARRFPNDGGACGFAWVRIDGTDGLARWCRKQIKLAIANADAIKLEPIQIENGMTKEYLARRNAEMQYGDKGYPRGWEFWNPGEYHGQNIDCKEAGAYAFRDVLAKYGIRADAGSRLD